MKAEAERVRTLLMDTVILLCKNGLRFEKELKVEGLIGITVDTDVFLVNINEQFSYCNDPVVLKQEQENSSLTYENSVMPFDQSDQASARQHARQRTTTSRPTYQQSIQFIDCDEPETFDCAVKAEAVDYDDGDDHRISARDDDCYNRYSHSETSLLVRTQETASQRSMPHWSLISNNGDGEVNDVTDDGLFMSAYAGSPASYAQQQQPLGHPDDHVQHAMVSLYDPSQRR